MPLAEEPRPDPVGNLTALPGRRFFIRTPSALAISDGAEFSVSVDGTGATNTRLASGLIEAWYPCGGKPDDLISWSARPWIWVEFSTQHDVRVICGTGKPPDLISTVFVNRAGKLWPPKLASGGSLRIWGLESRQPRATADILPRDQRGGTTN